MSTESSTTDPAMDLEAIVDANQYMTLATADSDGLPWASPVWYATADRREFLWVSAPQARHSRNLAVRPEVGIVIFDSTQPPNTGEGVYLSATAALVPGDDVDRGLAVYSDASEAKGIAGFQRSDVQAPARLRLYHAIATERFILTGKDARLPVDIAPSG
jgi:pyridoxine/pyridoxamine 5'-phosphate oxidase